MSSARYPEQTRLIAKACADLKLRFEDLDGGGGYLFEISDEMVAFVGGVGGICAYPLNLAAPVQIARDKAHANTVLARAGLPVIEGRLFFVSPRRKALRAPGREIPDAVAFVTAGVLPVFCKPNSGSGGDFAEVIAGADAFLDYLDRVAPHHEAILVQPVVEADEHRVFCLDGEAVFATAKADFALTGDGTSNLAELLAAANAKLAGIGVSPTPMGRLARPERVPARGERVVVAGRRNLAAGGAAQVTTQVAGPLADLALAAARSLPLRVAGVDIFDRSPARDLSDLVIVEVNGNPALTSLVQSGREDLALEIWRKVLAAHVSDLRKGSA